MEGVVGRDTKIDYFCVVVDVVFSIRGIVGKKVRRTCSTWSITLRTPFMVVLVIVTNSVGVSNRVWVSVALDRIMIYERMLMEEAIKDMIVVMN
ncbi:hypothetical protein HN51_016563 [Arachis hypogaea]